MMLNYLQKDDIVLINRLTILKHGGNFSEPSNFLHSENLDYLLEAVDATIFGEPMYPEIHQKAAVYMFNIIANHIFQDGNKRTGLGSALLFLKLNGYRLKKNLQKIVLEGNRTVPELGETTNQILFNFTIQVAEGSIDLETCMDWFAKNVEIKEK